MNGSNTVSDCVLKFPLAGFTTNTRPETVQERLMQTPTTAAAKASATEPDPSDVKAIFWFAGHEGFVRALWLERMKPTHDPAAFLSLWSGCWIRAYATLLRKIFSVDASSYEYVRVPLLGAERERHFTPEWFKTIHDFSSFEELVHNLFVDSAVAVYSDWDRQYLNTAIELFRSELSILDPNLLHTLHAITTEYMLWLRKHPDQVSRVAWDAFEKVIAEVFASKGFIVEFTGRVRNKTSDIIAVRTDEFGVDTRYLIECKRHNEDNLVCLAIVNQVLGAARRANVDHAFLVTTSDFTRDVLSHRIAFQELRLHLRNGDDLREWLRDYKPRTNGGLWLAEDWEDMV